MNGEDKAQRGDAIFKKLLLAFITLNALILVAALATLAIAFPQKNQSTPLEINGARAVEYHKREWKLLPIAYWGFNLAPTERNGCCDEAGGSTQERFFRFGPIGIADQQSITKIQEQPITGSRQAGEGG